MLSATEPTATIMLWVGFVSTGFALPAALPVLTVPSVPGAGYMLAMAVAAPGSIWLTTEGLRAGEASAVAPMQYLRLVVMAIAGLALFNEAMDLFTIAGAALIIGSVAMLQHHERRRAARHRSAP